MSSNRVTITTDSLVVEPVGVGTLWSFRRRLRFPLNHVLGADVAYDVGEEAKGWRAPGLRLPGRLAGTLRSRGSTQFWNVSGYDRVLVIRLESEKFDRLFITVADPHRLVDAIDAARASL